MEQKIETPFTYLVSEQSVVLVITFVGTMNDLGIETLERCKNEIAGYKDKKLIVLHFRDVDNVSGDAISVLTKIQLACRSLGATLSICSLKPVVREKLLKMGVVRQPEISNNLREALAQFLVLEKSS